MSTASNTLRLILIGEDKSASKAAKGVGDELEKSGKKAQTFHKVGAAAGIALAGGLALAGKAAFDMTKRAAEDEQASSKLARTLHATTGATKTQTDAVEAWITAQGKATGVTDDELRPALSKLVVATHSVSKAQRLAKLAQDVSIGTGKDLGAVSTALAKAQNGNVSGLSRLGVATKDADGKTKSLKDITKDLADTYGGAAARNADTAAGKQKILTTQYGELQEQIGAQLLPVMSKLLGIGLKVVNWISHNTKLVGTLVGVFGGLALAVWAITAATAAWNAVLSLNPIGIIVIALVALGVGLVIAYKKSETFRKIVQGAWAGIQIAARVAWAIIRPILSLWMAEIKAVGAVAKWLWNNAFSPALKFIMHGIAALISLWGHMLSALGKLPHMGWAKDAGAALQAAADKANGLADAIGKIPDHKNISMNVYTHHIGDPRHPTLPALANGGIVRRPTIALIGEAGPEAVVPLGKGHGGGEIHVHVSGLVPADEQQVIRKIHTGLTKLKAQGMGHQPLGLA